MTAPQPPSQLKKKKAPPKPKEKTHAGQQVIEFSPLAIEREGTLSFAKMRPVFYKDDSKGEDGWMVSGIIIPMTARAEISVSSSAVKGILMALWDSGCIRYLVSPQVVK